MLRFSFVAFLLMYCLLAKGQFSAASVSWLEGTWVNQKTAGKAILEIWEKMDARTWAGQGLGVSGMDTVQQETIQLYEKDGDLWYVPTVANQNDGQAIPFKLVHQEGRSFTFENPEHDFPQRIIYHYKPAQDRDSLTSQSGDTLSVRVESLDGKGFSIHFVKQ